MANDVASQVIWTLNSPSQGNKRIRRASSISTSDDSSVEAVGEVGSRTMVAFIEHPGGIMISIEGRETKTAKREINFERMKELGETFAMTRQVKGGVRIQFPECMIGTISYSDEEDGSTTYTVEIAVLERKAL